MTVTCMRIATSYLQEHGRISHMQDQSPCKFRHLQDNCELAEVRLTEPFVRRVTAIEAEKLEETREEREEFYRKLKEATQGHKGIS